MSVCVYSSMMQVKLPFIDLYALHPHGHTDAYALCFMGSYIARMQFSLGYNFLQCLQMPMHTAFQQILGNMTFVPVLGAGINVVLPILIVVVALLNSFNACTKFLAVSNT